MLACLKVAGSFSEEAFDNLEPYRGYRYFDKYEPVQLNRLVSLIDYLCNTYGITRQVPYPPLDYYGECLAEFKGIIGHAMVRRDKSDPMPDMSFWDHIVAENKLEPVAIANAASPKRSA